jgi:hypothetical protein
VVGLRQGRCAGRLVQGSARLTSREIVLDLHVDLGRHRVHLGSGGCQSQRRKPPRPEL